MTREQVYEIVRFGIVGVIATAIQYAVYWCLIGHMSETIANAIGYGISFVCNFILTTYFTFKVKPNRKRAGGFAFSHLVNLGLQTVVLNTALWLGVPSEWAPIPMFAICVPTTFLLVRFFFKQ